MTGNGWETERQRGENGEKTRNCKGAFAGQPKEIPFSKQRQKYRKDHEADFSIHFAAKAKQERPHMIPCSHFCFQGKNCRLSAWQTE